MLANCNRKCYTRGMPEQPQPLAKPDPDALRLDVAMTLAEAEAASDAFLARALAEKREEPEYAI